MFVLWQRRTQESRLQIQHCDMFKLRRTHNEIEPSPEVIVEAVWCMTVRNTVDEEHCDGIEKHDVSSDHRDKSKFTEFPEHRDESNFRRVIKNIEMDQNPGKVIENIETDQNSRKIITSIETGQNSEK